MSFYFSHPHPPPYQRSEELSGWAEQVQRVVDVPAGEKLEQRGRDMATGKERREERRDSERESDEKGNRSSHCHVLLRSS
jgi:hypothetical protein